MILELEDCIKIKNDTHEKFVKNDSEILDSFKAKTRIRLTFTDVSSLNLYEGIYESGENVTKKQFEFKQIN